ncbi:MAG: regulatory protein RecX [Actinomycetota bacterium]|nr:regulatory protein RecX [Actinomycetota bacterium]
MVRAQRLIATRERSSFELLSRLATAGYPDAVCEEVVARCVRASLVDDERFTRVYVSSKQQAGWGRARILRGLRQAGIDPSSYPGTWEESFDDEDELRRALSLLEHHRTSSKDPYRALYAYLMRKGFSSEVSSRAVSLHLNA